MYAPENWSGGCRTGSYGPVWCHIWSWKSCFRW